MNADSLRAEIQKAFQDAADILGISFETAIKEEQDLIIEMSAVKEHHLEWYLAIGSWKGFTGRNL